MTAVRDNAEANARRMARFFSGDRERLVRVVRQAAEFHDLGKLDAANQGVLAAGDARKPLPINHVDAGVAQLVAPASRDMAAAICVFAHHIGLPGFAELLNAKSRHVLRDTSALASGFTTREHVNELLSQYLDRHRRSMGYRRIDPEPATAVLPTQLSWRLALSCLVDADHHDTAQNYGEPAAYEAPLLCEQPRLALLDAHVRSLARSGQDERQQLRAAIYDA